MAGGTCVPRGRECRGGHACLGGVHVWGMHAWGACVACTLSWPDTTRYGRSMSRQYASYWNAFLFFVAITFSRNVDAFLRVLLPQVRTSKSKFLINPFITVNVLLLLMNMDDPGEEHSLLTALRIVLKFMFMRKYFLKFSQTKKT